MNGRILQTRGWGERERREKTFKLVQFLHTRPHISTNTKQYTKSFSLVGAARVWFVLNTTFRRSEYANAFSRSIRICSVTRSAASVWSVNHARMNYASTRTHYGPQKYRMLFYFNRWNDRNTHRSMCSQNNFYFAFENKQKQEQRNWLTESVTELVNRTACHWKLIRKYYSLIFLSRVSIGRKILWKYLGENFDK